jgi:hypothetical protein
MAAPHAASVNHVPEYMRCVMGMTNVSARLPICLVTGYDPARNGSGCTHSTKTTAAGARAVDTLLLVLELCCALSFTCAAKPGTSSHENSLRAGRCAIANMPGCADGDGGVCGSARGAPEVCLYMQVRVYVCAWSVYIQGGARH